MVRNTVSFLEAVAATAADVSLAGHILAIKGCPPVDTRLVEKFVLTSTVAETAQVTTVTPTNAASSNFSLQIQQFVPSIGTYVQVAYLSNVTAASGSSATTICDAWRSQLALTNNLRITASGTTTLILTAKAITAPTGTNGGGAPIFRVIQVDSGNPANVTPVYPMGTIGIVTGTAGVHSVNTTNDLLFLGYSDAVAGETYTSLRMQYRDASVNESAGNVSQGRNVHTLFINNGDVDAADLVTRLGQIRDGLDSAGTAADAEISALG